MSVWLTVIGALFQIILLLIQSYSAKDADVKKVSADKAKEIADAVSSGDHSRINAVITGMRK